MLMLTKLLSTVSDLYGYLPANNLGSRLHITRFKQMTDREKRDGRSNGGWGSGKDFLRFHGSYSIYILKDYCPYSQRGCK